MTSHTYTIPTFCKSRNISEATYYRMKKIGRGPREQRIGSKVTITPEAATDWDREVETNPIPTLYKRTGAPEAA